MSTVKKTWWSTSGGEEQCRASGSHSIIMHWFFLIGLAMLMYYMIRLNSLQDEQQKNIMAIMNKLNESGQRWKAEDHSCQHNKPLAWVYGEEMHVGYLHHVIDLFQKVGFRVWTKREEPPREEHGDWIILWAHEYPFSPSYQLPKLKPFQKVNHFPGSGFVTNKVSLATSGLKHIPRAFNLPREKEEFLKFAKENPDKLWVQKDNNHRGIQVKNIEQLDLDQKGTFVQEFIQNPLLIDGRKFDIGLYVTMTSLNPLRLYIYDNEALLRFCAKSYPEVFNASDLDTYVVGDKYTPIWEIPSLAKYYTGLNMNMKDSLNAYIRLVLPKDPQAMWQAMEESIKTIYYLKEEQMLQLAMVYPSMRNFFEMVRFDFTVDQDLNVYLMEANMSPNLASAKYPPNRLIYEQVIYGVFSLVGITQMPLMYGTWANKPPQFWDMLVQDKDLSILPEICSLDICLSSSNQSSSPNHSVSAQCTDEQCDTCFHCLTEEMKTILKDAFMEEMNRYNNRRLIPSTSKESPVAIPGQNTYLQDKWFIGKCLLHDKWCN